MANFEWLNNIPDEEWKGQGSWPHALARLYDVDIFRSQSCCECDDDWLEIFSLWGRTQPRNYYAEGPPFKGLDKVLICGLEEHQPIPERPIWD